MVALITGMELSLDLANRLKVYVAQMRQLPNNLARSNFEKAVVRSYAHLLRFFAGAIESYQKGTMRRLWQALGETLELENFKTESDRLSAQVDIEASNCDRELSEQDRVNARQWKADLDASLQKLDDIAALQNSINQLHRKADLAKLLPARDAVFDSFANADLPYCMPGTRVDILNQVAQWSESRASKRVFWLCGKAGTGKSTISRSLSKTFDAHGRLGANFFFKRGEGDRGNASRFVATIVLQLVRRIPDLDHEVASALESEHGMTDKGVQHQFEKLLIGPLAKLPASSMPSFSIVIVIDALDECDRDFDKAHVVRLLSRLQEIPNLRTQIFLTSRPDLPIKLGFRRLSGEIHHDVKLEELQAPTIEHDIRKYIEHEFRAIAVETCLLQPNDPLPENWPGADTIDALVRISIPLFIFASTICRFIARGDPRNRLARVLDQSERTTFSSMHSSYQPVLDLLLLDQEESESERIVQQFKKVVGTIVILAEPLSARSLERLLIVPIRQINAQLRQLDAVLSIPSSPDEPIRPFHLSFPEFLLDQRREGKTPFHIDAQTSHSQLAAHCLRLLNGSTGFKHDRLGNSIKASDGSLGLRRNLLGIEAPGTLRSDVDDQTIQHHISPELRYACSYWAWHVIESGETIRSGGPVHSFLKTRFLYWLEALCWLRRISAAATQLQDLQFSVKV